MQRFSHSAANTLISLASHLAACAFSAVVAALATRRIIDIGVTLAHGHRGMRRS